MELAPYQDASLGNGGLLDDLSSLNQGLESMMLTSSYHFDVDERSFSCLGVLKGRSRI